MLGTCRYPAAPSNQKTVSYLGNNLKFNKKIILNSGSRDGYKTIEFDLLQLDSQ